MKKNVLISVAVFFIMIIAAFNVKFSLRKNDLPELMLQNIDALALGLSEWTDDGWVCFKYSYDDYSSSLFFTYTRCMDCSSSSAMSVWGQGRCHFN